MMKKQSQSPVIRLAATGIAMVLILQFSDVNTMVTDHVNSLEVYGQMSETSAATVKPTPEFDKILSKFAAKSSTLSSRPSASGANGDMDSLFSKVTAQSSSEITLSSMPPDDLAKYESAVSSIGLTDVASRALLQAITPTGAVISGVYVEKGQAVAEAKYTSIKGEVTPVLKTVTATYVILEYPDNTSIKLYLSSPLPR